jgi:hypothetical protein
MSLFGMFVIGYTVGVVTGLLLSAVIVLVMTVRNK